MSLLAWYPLIANGNNQGLDDVNLTTVGAVTYTTGKLGNAAKFTGNSGVRFRRSNFTEQTNWSVTAWVKCDEATSATQWCFNNGRDSNNDGWHCYFKADGTTLYLRIGSTTWSMTSTLGTWYHVAMTIDENSKYTFFVNGEQKSTGTVTTLPDYTESGNLMAIGGFVYNGGNIYPLNGQVQDFRYYNHCLSKKEVKEISKGLTIHLPMNWGSGKPNMIKLSYTFMNKSAGSSNQWTNSGLTYDSSTVTENDTAPCRWVMKRVITNTKTSNVSGAGCFYGIGTQGLALTDLVEGETYTYSFWAKSDSGIFGGLSPVAICESQTLVSNTGFGALDSNWRKHTVTFKWTKTTRLTACFYTTVPANSTVDFQVCGIKLEKGNVATPYIPHVEETIYTEKGFGVNYKDECSGYNRGITSGGTAVIGEESPRGTGTYCTSGCYLQATSGFPLSSAMPSWTITLWFKPDIGKTFTSWSDVFRFWMNTETGNNTHFRLETQNKSGNNYCLYYNNSGASSYGGGALTTITENKWYHLAFCCDSTKIYQYVNSELKITHTINTGYKPTGPTGYFQIGDGGMYASYADVRVYAICLSADDVKELYQVSAQIDKSGNFYCGQLVEV